MDSGSTEPYGNRNAAAAAHLQYGITLVHPCLKQFAVKTIESQSSTLTAATVAYFKTNFHDFSQTIYFILDNWKNGGFDQGCKKMLKTYLRRCRNIRNDVSHQTYRNTDSHDRRIEDLCHVMREIGHPLEAENLQNFMKPQPLVNTSWEKLKQLGNQHYKEGRYTEAMISYTEALKEKPDEPALYSNRALCEMQLERFEDARNDAEDALNLDANNVKFYRILSEALVKLGNLEEALAACERGLEIDPRDGVLLVRQRDFQAMMVMKTTNQHPRRDTKEFMEKSNEMIFDPNDSDLFQRFFAQNPDPKDIRVLDDAQYNQYAKFLALLREAHSYLNGARQQSKDPKMAFKIFKEAAELGCAEGQYNLGHLYANGLGTNADYALMLRYYRLAAEHKPFVKWGARIMSELGVAEAENALGNVYRDGRGVDVDYAKAFRHYTRAASWGQPEAQNNMGCFLSNGLGVAKNYQFARSWFERAAKHGLAEAQMNYAEMLEDGRGGPVDEEGALEYFQKAAKQGMPGAIEALHRMAVNGSASQPHKAAFEDLLKSSTANKDINALFFKGNMENEMRNYDEAVICWKAAADLGHLESKIVLWNLLLHRKRQNESAFLYCLEASQAGDVESQLRLTVLYATGTGCARDAAAAKKWFQRAVSRIPGESSQYMSQKEFDELLVTAERVCSFETRMSLSSKGLKWEQRLLRYMEARDVSEDDRRMIENYRHIQRLSELPDPLPVSTNIPSIIRKPDMQAVILAAERGSTVAADVAKAWRINAEALQAWNLGNHNRAFSLFREAQKYHDVVEIHNFDMVAFIEEQSLNTTDAMFVKACHFGNNIQGSIYYVLRCIRKHPMEADFHNLLANLYGFAGRFDDSLSSAQRAYEIEARPNFLYTIATAMRMRLPAPDERRKKIKQKLYDKARPKVIEAYLKFLDHNPRDHRKVPTVLFCLASLHLTSDMSEIGKVRKYYEEACTAEERRLPCFEAVADSFPPKDTVKRILKLQGFAGREKDT